MKLLDVDHQKSLENIAIYLTKDEAKEMCDLLKDLIQQNKKNDHIHINDAEYKHEITIVVYDKADLNGLDTISKKIINEHTIND